MRVVNDCLHMVVVYGQGVARVYTVRDCRRVRRYGGLGWLGRVRRRPPNTPRTPAAAGRRCCRQGGAVAPGLLVTPGRTAITGPGVSTPTPEKAKKKSEKIKAFSKRIANSDGGSSGCNPNCKKHRGKPKITVTCLGGKNTVRGDGVY